MVCALFWSCLGADKRPTFNIWVCVGELGRDLPLSKRNCREIATGLPPVCGVLMEMRCPRRRLLPSPATQQSSARSRPQPPPVSSERSLHPGKKPHAHAHPQPLAINHQSASVSTSCLFWALRANGTTRCAAFPGWLLSLSVMFLLAHAVARVGTAFLARLSDTPLWKGTTLLVHRH